MLKPGVHSGKLFWRVLVIGVLLLGSPRGTRADTAPALEESRVIGSIVSPYKFIKTRVRMLDEQVSLKVEAVPAGESLFSRVVVQADFHMFNTGSLTETMKAVFPLTDLRCPWIAGPGSWIIQEHTVDEGSFAVSLDGISTPTRVITTTTVISTPVPGLLLDCKTRWRSFHVSFLPRKHVRIRVSYRLEPGNELAYPWDSFTYILKTGEAWFGTIGQVDVSLQLPYHIRQEHLLHVPFGYRSLGDTLHWRWLDLEPAQNLKMVVLSPQTHQELEIAKERVLDHPQDTQGWLALAKLYEQMASRYDYQAICGSTIENATFPEIQNWQFADLALDTYRQAIRQHSASYELHARLAYLLASMSLSGNRGRVLADFPSVRRAFQVFEQAMALGDTSDLEYYLDGFKACMVDSAEAPASCTCGL